MSLLNLTVIQDIRDTEYLIIEFAGELDQGSLPDAEQKITEVVGTLRQPVLIFDFNRLDFINSEGIGFVVTIHTKLAKKNKKLILCALQSHVADVCNAIGLPSLIPLLPDRKAAIAFAKHHS